MPSDLPSGVYTARLKAGGETDDLPFLVCPRNGQATAPLALLVPTFTYVAYGNEMWRDYGLNCAYDRYVDGAGVPFASLRHPIKTFRPGRGLLKSVAGEHFGRHLCADLYAVDWLDAIDQPVDIITDHDLHREGEALLKPYKAVMTGSHPEYVSGGCWMRSKPISAPAAASLISVATGFTASPRCRKTATPSRCAGPMARGPGSPIPARHGTR